MRLYEISAETNEIVFDTGTVWYHGSKTGFWEFDSEYVGTGIVNANASGGFYFSSNRDSALYFADAETAVKDSYNNWNYDDINVYGGDGEYYFVIGYDKEDAMSSELAWIKGTEFDNRRTAVNRGPFNTEDDALKAGRQIVDEYNAAHPGQTFYYDDKIVAVYLALGKTLTVRSMDELRALEGRAHEEGYDSILALNVVDGDLESDVAVVFDTNRIKMI